MQWETHSVQLLHATESVHACWAYVQKLLIGGQSGTIRWVRLLICEGRIHKDHSLHAQEPQHGCIPASAASRGAVGTEAPGRATSHAHLSVIRLVPRAARDCSAGSQSKYSLLGTLQPSRASAGWPCNLIPRSTSALRSCPSCEQWESCDRSNGYCWTVHRVSCSAGDSAVLQSLTAG